MKKPGNYFKGKKRMLLYLLLAVNQVTAQNTYDTYKNYDGQSVTMLEPNPCQPNYLQGYLGEYELFMKDLHWFTDPNLSGFAKSYSIEVVSFPFAPDCSNGECGTSSSSTRHMIIPNTTSTGWSRTYPNMSNATIQMSKFFQDEFPGTSYPYQSHNFTLVGAFFTAAAPPGSGRVYLPHTVLKHTVYIHSGSSVNDPVVDQFSFVLDHTRGAMSAYPFKSNNAQSGAGQHDITVFPGYTFASTEYYNGQTTNARSTLNYYPLGEVLPLDLDGIGGPDLAPVPTSYSDDPHMYIHPSPYAMLNVRLSSEPGGTLAGYTTLCNNMVYSNTALSTRAYHSYTINQPVDLTTFNTLEKVIYNPSSVEINIPGGNHTQVFPSGYTFKTANALYPTAAQANAALSTTATNDPRYAHVSTTLTNTNETSTTANEQLSYYYVRNGSKLVIESCVTIYDAVITVDAGGVLEYDPTKTYGNFQIVNNGGTVSIQTYSPTAFACGMACQDETYYDIGYINPPPGYTWSVNNLPLDMDNDGIMRVNGLIQVTTGRTMTINAGVRVEFGPQGGFYVEPGAQLILNGSSGNEVVLTSACQNMWKGIQVLGDVTAPQSASAHGTVDMQYTVVENAHTGVLLGRKDIPALNGGILHADHCSFKNNGISIEFLPYSNFTVFNFGSFAFAIPIPNTSNITSSTFDTDNYLFDNSYSLYNERSASLAHIKAERTFALKIANNTFTTSAVDGNGDPLFKPHLRGTGIDLTDSWQSFSNNCLIPSSSGCAAYEKNHFSNLSEGISSKYSLVNARHFGCEGQDFTNNIYGIVLLNNRLSKIKDNHFEIPLSEEVDYTSYLDPTLKAFNKPVGLYMKNSAFFSVEENEFENYNSQVPSTSTATDHYNYGAVINNSALASFDGTGLLYLNTFSNLCIGTQMEEDNMGWDGYSEWSQGGSGMQAKCGTYDDQVFSDWMIPGSQFLGQYAVLRTQGNCTGANGPAGNTFNSTSSHIGGVPSQPFDYHSHSDLLPTIFNSNVGVIDCGYNASGGTCISIGCGLPCFEESYNGNSQGIAQQKDNLLNLIDGGDKAALMEIIGDGSGDDITAALLDASPYLSDEVMIAAFEMLEDESQIESIALANSKLSPQVMEILMGLSLSDGVMANIEAAQTGVSPRQFEYDLLNDLLWDQKVLQKQMIYEYMMINDNKRVIELMKDDLSLNGKMQWLADLIKMKNYTAADAVLSSIYTNNPGISNDFLKLAEIQLDLDRNGKTIKDLSSSQLVSLQQIASHGPDGTGAQLVLSRLMNKKTDHTPYDYNSNSAKIMQALPSQTITESSPAFKLYPNPVTGGDVTLLIEGNEKDQREIKVFDLVGKMVSSVTVADHSKFANISSKSLPGNGMYMVTLFVNGKKTSSQRLMVTR